MAEEFPEKLVIPVASGVSKRIDSFVAKHNKNHDNPSTTRAGVARMWIMQGLEAEKERGADR